MLQVGIFRRVCSDGLVVSDETFGAIRFRHSGLKTDEVVQASERVIEFVPRLAGMIDRFRRRLLVEPEAVDFAARALALRWGVLIHDLWVRARMREEKEAARQPQKPAA